MSVDYTVRTKYEVIDGASSAIKKIGDGAKNAASGLESLKASLVSGVGSAFGSIGSMMDSMASKAMAVGKAVVAGGAVAGMVGLKKGLVDVNASLEDAGIGFATIFNMTGLAKNFNSGLLMSKTLIEDIRKDAAALPGEFGDFVQMAQTLSSPLINAGKGLNDIRDLTSKTVVATASVIGKGSGAMQQGAREMAQLLEGHAGGHNVLGARLGINTNTKIGDKKFNEASQAERYEFLSKKLEKAKDSLGAFQNSWSGLTSTMIDGIKALLGKATLPLFNRLKEYLQDINAQLESPMVTKLAGQVGEALVEAFDWMVTKMRWIAEHFEDIKKSAITFGTEIKAVFVAILPIIQKIAHFLANEMKDPGKALVKYLALRAAVGAGSMAPGMIMAGGSFMAAKSAGDAAKAATTATTAVGTETATTSAATTAAGGSAAGLAAALGVALLAFVGAVDNTQRKIGEHGAFYDQLTDWQLDMNRFVKGEVMTGFNELKDTLKDFWSAVKPLVDLMGIALMGAIVIVVDTLRLLLWPIRKLGEAMAWVVNKIPGLEKQTNVYGGSKLNGDPSFKNHVGNGKGKLVELVAFPSNEEAFGVVDYKPTGSLKGAGKTTVNVNVQMSVLSDSDPERLAQKIATNLDRTLRNPTRAPGVRNYQTQ